MKKLLILSCVLTSLSLWANDPSENYQLIIQAKDKYERSAIADIGIQIESVQSEFVTAYGNQDEIQKLEALEIPFQKSENPTSIFDFPPTDSAFHNYSELVEKIRSLEKQNSEFVQIQTLGQTVENRDILGVKLGLISNDNNTPEILFVGGHHAREHLTVQLCLDLMDYLIQEYNKKNPRIVTLLNTRIIHIIPNLNPDGSEYDISSGSYRQWRKNRRPNSSSYYGVDLNRNYSFKWATVGSSSSPYSDTYHGTQPFSEPETLALKNYIEAHPQISILLTFHSFSALILYPWGFTYDPIGENGQGNPNDFRVHKIMAEKMAQWNGYTPQQTSSLYRASGDTTDWAYGVRRIFSFTFELDPRSMSEGGFYPGANWIPKVFKKNLEPCLYLMELADNPYRVLESRSNPYGIHDQLLN